VIIYEGRLINQQNGTERSFGIEVALIQNMLCTICLVVSIYIRYDIWLKWSITVQKYTVYDNLINTGLWRVMVVEMGINCIAPYPFLDGMMYEEDVEAFGVIIQYEINDLLLFFMFFRLYLGLKFILYLTQFMNPRS